MRWFMRRIRRINAAVKPMSTVDSEQAKAEKLPFCQRSAESKR